VSWGTSNTYKEDSNSFVISVNNSTLYPIQEKYQNAIYCGAHGGPTFDGGHDLFVADCSNENTYSFAKPGDYSYEIGSDENVNSMMTGGNEYFRAIEIEVYCIQ
jgi:hypothetical protein